MRSQFRTGSMPPPLTNHMTTKMPTHQATLYTCAFLAQGRLNTAPKSDAVTLELRPRAQAVLERRLARVSRLVGEVLKLFLVQLGHNFAEHINGTNRTFPLILCAQVLLRCRHIAPLRRQQLQQPLGAAECGVSFLLGGVVPLVRRERAALGERGTRELEYTRLCIIRDI